MRTPTRSSPIRAVSRRSPRPWKRSAPHLHGVYQVEHACADYRELVDRDDVDLIDVCTPPSTHEEIVTAALQAGKYVLCEKPLAHSLAAADRIIAVANEHPGKLSVVYQLRYNPDFRRLLALRDAGLLGELRCGNFTRHAQLQGSAAVSSGWWGKWSVAGGGAVMTQFVHQLDQMCCVFGRPASVTAQMATLQQPIESEDTFSATIVFESGAIVNAFGTLNANSTGQWNDVFGSKASAHQPWAFRCTDAQQRQRIKEVLRDMDAPAAASASANGPHGRKTIELACRARREKADRPQAGESRRTAGQTGQRSPDVYPRRVRGHGREPPPAEHGAGSPAVRRTVYGHLCLGDSWKHGRVAVGTGKSLL